MTAVSQELSKKKKDKEYKVVINGTETFLEHDRITYEELGEPAFPGHDPAAMFTVTYRHADPSHGGKASGTLVAGESVKVKKKGTEFHVRLTTRS
ncbi:multiubiquitin domain-containing protein [Mycolicibacterium fortuitum]|uniref:multiubiquitin domain-containing protein n=1 Tax=Mycolicibacterium fortuitum TaxID=1766 RepID=UPI0022BA1321|nr:multiubiquitin domain-containing protein [Mycolicibacterium fortuitum]WAY19035.1 multiubiquitin domain-containing protein [Mycolicibacterium fortuitum]